MALQDGGVGGDARCRRKVGATWRRRVAKQGRDTTQWRPRYKVQQALLPDLVNESSLVCRQKASRSDTARWRIRRTQV